MLAGCKYSMKNNIDIRLDEKLSVEEMLNEVAKTFSFDKRLAQVVSVNRRKVLDKRKSLMAQGILGGDTLILIERKNDEYTG